MRNIHVDLEIPGHDLITFAKMYAENRNMSSVIKERIKSCCEPGHTICYIFSEGGMMPGNSLYYDKLGSALYFGFIYQEYSPEEVIAYTNRLCNVKTNKIKQRDFEPMLGRFRSECNNFFYIKDNDFYFNKESEDEMLHLLHELKYCIDKYKIKYQLIKTDHRTIVRIYSFNPEDLKNYAFQTRQALGDAIAFESEDGVKYIKIGAMVDDITGHRISEPLCTECVGVLR